MKPPVSTAPDPVTPAPIIPAIATTLQGGLETALATVERNRPHFTQVFPDHTTRADRYPPRAAEFGEPEGGNTGWTTGFWTGQLWLAYEATGNAPACAAARVQVRSFADRLARKVDVDHHDLGFLYTLSCVAAHRLTGDLAARGVALAAAEQLLSRYLPGAGVIQAWGALHHPELRGRVIIDCLMNLPLLHWAAHETGDERYRAAACSHARRSAQTLVRADDTTYHTYFFDADSGVALRGETHQGLRHDSCWSRGQAWGVYGFALAHRHEPEGGFLEIAIRLAEYFLRHLPEDGVAYWDLAFTDPSPEPRDSSAAAILACGLLEIARHAPHLAARYEQAALGLLASLVQNYAHRDGQPCAPLLRHGVYSRPAGEGVDEGTLWGDYFYLEALTRATRPWTPYWWATP